MSERTKAGTGATTAGLVPDTVGVVLLAVVVGTVVLFTSQLGYSSEPVALVAASGTAAALGVRVASTGSSRNLVVGVTTLWLSALAFTGGSVLLVVRQPPSGITAALSVPVVASAALLAPFGVVSNTIRSYGQGAGSAVLRRYLIGTALLALLVIVLGAVSVLQILGAEVLLAPLPGAEELLAVLESLLVRVTVAIIVYTAAFVTVPWAARSFPAEVFVPVTDLDRLSAFRRSVATASRYGLRLVFGYLVVAALAAVAIAAPEDLSGTEAQVVEFLSSVAVPITRAGASRSALVAVGSATVLVIAGVSTLGWLRDLGTVSGADVAESVVPPAILFALVLGLATGFADRLPLATVETQLAVFADPGSVVYEVIIGRPRLVVLGLVTLAILVSGLVLAIPVVIAGATPGDESLTGIVASIASLTALVVLAVFEGKPLFLIIVGVGSIAVVWELGEYATVAVGELRSQGEAGTLPAGFTTLLSVHALVTLCVTVIGAAVVLGLTTLAVGATLPITAALPAVLATVVGLAALMLLLTG
jgi:hypothetical protein